MARPRNGLRLKTVSLFSGAGGLDIGFERAGFEVVLAIESDPNCVRTLVANGHHDVWHADLSDEALVTPRRVLQRSGLRAGEVDAVIGGPPCQSFSTPGRRKGLRDSRGQLVKHFCRLVGGLRPRVFVFENVPGILNASMRGVLRLIRSELGVGGELGARGYEMSIGLLNAAAFGVPQLRQRAFIVGWSRPGSFYFPDGTHYLPGHQEAQGKDRFKTVADAFRGLPTPERPSRTARRVALTIAKRNKQWHGK
jgi:DNA (cytosine-5)-methyltransferase 1